MKAVVMLMHEISDGNYRNLKQDFVGLSATLRVKTRSESTLKVQNLQTPATFYT